MLIDEIFDSTVPPLTKKGKQEIIKKLLEEKVRTDLPASFLWLHDNVECLIDQHSV